MEIGGFVASGEMWENVLLIQPMQLIQMTLMRWYRGEDIVFHFGLVFLRISCDETEM